MSVHPDQDSDITLNRAWAEHVFSSPHRVSMPSLPFSFVYGGRPSTEFLDQWESEAHEEMTGDTMICRTVTLMDPSTRLEVKAVARIYLDTPGVDWTVYFTNRGQADSPILEQIKAVDVQERLEPPAQVVLHRLNGSLCAADDWMPFDQAVPEGQTVAFGTTLGRSSNISPWFTIDWGRGGLVAAIGWSGQWNASVGFDDGCVALQAGMQYLHTVLRPGESLRSPRMLLMRWQGDEPSQALNAFRRTLFAHILPRIDGQLVIPPIVHLSTSFYELNASNEENVLSHLQSIQDLGFEMFWLDAYWTGPDGFPNSMGNYGFPLERVEPQDRFPHGLRAIGEAVEKAGLGFMLWFEPERVATGTYLAREHPDWVISPNGDGSGLFNLGIPAARDYMTGYLNAAIKAYKLSGLRIDYNIDPLPYWQWMNAQDPQRTGMVEMRYVEGLYRMWDDILAANPHLFIDDCASGGRRIDLETISRAIPLWRSDNTCDMVEHKPASIPLAAIKNQVMSGGLNRYVPFSTCGQMGATPYLFRSGFNAGISFCQDVRPADYPRELLKQGIAEGKRNRKYFFGNFYPLVESGVDAGGWCILQYHRPLDKDGMLVAFRREQAEASQCRCWLQEIDPAARYHLDFYYDYILAKTETVSGADLQDLLVNIPEKPGSLIIEYKEIK